ncbi:hydrolase, putative [Minicystis rosea]|nr:hydrolase, putative [Minicystis rosea]
MSPPRPRPRLLALAALVMATALWLPSLHLFYRPAPAAKQADGLLARQLDLFREKERHAREAGRMRRTNAEWDFMGRTYLAWSLAELALRDPARREERLAALDSIIDDTLRLERQEGLYYFLMPYAQRSAWVMDPPRSQFTDGEIALMLALRRMVAEKEAYKAPLAERVQAMVDRMQKSPTLSAESYPDECWSFCNAVALAAIKAGDILDGTDHRAFLKSWIETAKAKLVDPATGLLVSSYTLAGKTKDGPEGSSIWMVAHALRAVDPVFAEDQYTRAKKTLAQTILGFGYAREWPAGRRGPVDVDSGPIVPLLDVSAGSSGLAFVAAASFGDSQYLGALRTTLDFAAFPTEHGGKIGYAASNQVGDAVVLYALSLGPLWDALRDGRRP